MFKKKKRKKKRGFEYARARAFYIIMIPFMVFLILTKGYPIVWGFYISFTNFNGFNLDKLVFVGLDNYIQVFKDPEVLPALWRAIRIGVVHVPLTMTISTALSLLLTKQRKGVGIFRTLLYIPSVIPTVATAIIWYQVFNYEGGLLNSMLELFGVKRINWFGADTFTFSIILMLAWGCTGGIFARIAAIKQIPEDLYEAARIEGAGFWYQTIRITLPMISNMLYMGVTTGIIGILQLFGIVVMITGLAQPNGNAGLSAVPISPGYTMMVHIYQQIFSKMRFGYGLALVWVFFAFIMLITAILEYTKPYWVYTETTEMKSFRKKKR